MFRLVCLKHKVELGIVRRATILVPAYDRSWHWNLSDAFCPELDAESALTGKSLYETDESCKSRWYVVDKVGYQVYMDVKDVEDKETFAKLDPFKTWRQNLGIKDE